MQDQITRRKAVAGIGGLTTTAVLAGCSLSADDGDSASSDGGNGSENGNGDDSGSVDILEHEIQTGELGDMINVIGEIQNNTGEEQGYIKLTAVFYDSEGTHVDDSMTTFSDVPDGETVAFKIRTPLKEGQFDNYELETSALLKIGENVGSVISTVVI